jgi:dTDP-4-dehydrorhamnose reductase
MWNSDRPTAVRILLTGGSGRLGRELLRLLPAIVAPPHATLDITRPQTIEGEIERLRPDLIVHAAAYTDVAGAERDKAGCWQTNVLGTRNIVRASLRHSLRLVHISTDYVFAGTRGMYLEDDVPGPVRNYYALSKLVAEEAAHFAPGSLVIRTSFRGREFPYPVAYADLFTSQDYVDVIAPEIALAVRRVDRIADATLHIATERKSVFDLARRRRPDVRPGSRRDAAVELPEDISLDTRRWRELRAKLATPEQGVR